MCDKFTYRSADKSLARPRRKQARKNVRDARDFNNIETQAVIKFLFLQGKAPKEIHAILTETLACCLSGRARFQQNRDASCHQVSFPAGQGAEGNSRHSDRNISLLPFWSRAISTKSRRELSSSFSSCRARRRRKFTLF